MWARITLQLTVPVLFGVAAYYTAKCPCDTLVSCHRKTVYGSATAALLLLETARLNNI